MIVVRPARIFPLIALVGGTGLGGYMLYRSGGYDGKLLGLVWFVGGILAFVNYFWFHYVAIDEKGVRQVKYFGFKKLWVPLDQITEVATRPLRTSYGILAPTPSIRICWNDGMIELSPTAYWATPMRRALLHLNRKGIPIDQILWKAYKLEEAGGRPVPPISGSVSKRTTYPPSTPER